MDVKLLETFRAVVEHRSMTRAADALGVTQPAVSGHIARLEAQLGFALFAKVGRRVQPTAEARLLYEEAINALHGLERLAHLTLDIRHVRLGQLTIASHPWAAISVLPESCARFLRSRPEVRLRLVTRTSDALRDVLQLQAFDLGIVEPPIDRNLVKLSGHRIACVAALPHGHRLSRHDVIRPEHLEGETFVTSYPGHPVHYEIRRAFEQRGMRWAPSIEAQFGITVAAVVAQGAGIGIVDPFSAAAFADRGLAIRRFEPSIYYEIAIVHPVQREPSLLATEFMKFLQVEIETKVDLKAAGKIPIVAP